MKRLQTILCASLLTLALSSATFAGNIYGRSGNIYGGPSELDVNGNIYGFTDEILNAGVGILNSILP